MDCGSTGVEYPSADSPPRLSRSTEKWRPVGVCTCTNGTICVPGIMQISPSNFIFPITPILGQKYHFCQTTLDQFFPSGEPTMFNPQIREMSRPKAE